MNLQDGSGGEARIQFSDADFDIIVPGSYIACAITGVKIPLGSLRYWNVDRQEAYADAAAASKGFGLIGNKA